jgi:hypothetical protein
MYKILLRTSFAVLIFGCNSFASSTLIFPRARKDIIDGGGFCITSSYFFINGRVWDCGGGSTRKLRFSPEPK